MLDLFLSTIVLAAPCTDLSPDVRLCEEILEIKVPKRVRSLNLGSMRSNASGKIEMWSTMRYKPATNMGGLSVGEMKFQEEFDCKFKKFRTVSIAVFDEDGSFLQRVEADRQWTSPVPGSDAEMSWSLACE